MAKVAGKQRLRDWAVAVPAVLLAVASGLFVVDATGGTERSKTEMKVALPQTVTIKPRTMTYRADGDFQKNNYPVDAPLTTRKLRHSFEIMKYQVTGAEYRRCVDDGACQPPEDLPHNRNWASADKPVVGVSYTDAEDYAAWLSKKTGSVWHLPTDEQWAFAAGTRFADDAVGIEGDESKNPALRWLRDYEQQSARKQDRNQTVRPLGAFGENEYGLADIGGNVWEWTQTCHRRVNIDAYGKVASETTVCGVYVVNGKHRAAMSSFIRNPKTGGCSVGVPPDNLGFRLVRDGRWYAPVLMRLKDFTS
ncbi:MULTISPECIES: formylglycine-generating enzyme family protein [unclassified Brucella]|uniref:formylglycine-generating enzyme family protein n=1 Tax=unclassified Brucella TaxID=2632610 RepID=UPI00217E9308|nr:MULTISPECIES: formylglycine-generating enzyme family protein [unclassified Brucella]UWF68076.1 formylglycine-generating enzyme family protein [Brucella sp. 1315]UWF71193.1 formylglycine-generating enzyme family protein [Brucella sp. 2594]